jgi:hypothetical protein
MSLVKFFGNKEIFAIEFGETKNVKKFLLRLWLTGLPKGNFRKSALVVDTVNDFEAILKNRGTLYLPIFDSMSMEEIFFYTTKFNFRLDEDSERYNQTKHLARHAFTGPQFSNTQSDGIVLIKEGQLRLIWRNDFGEPVNDAVVPFKYFCDVFNEFINYCKGNGLI